MIFSKKQTSPLKYGKWEDISISKYYDIVDIIEEEDTDDVVKTIKLLSITMDKDEDELWNMTPDELYEYSQHLTFINSFDFGKRKPIKKVAFQYVNNVEDEDKDLYNVCKVMDDFSKFTVSQYIDFQQIWKMDDLRNNYGRLLATIVIPKGYKYGNGYDLEKMANIIMTQLPITEANTLLFFCLVKLRKLTSETMKTLNKQMKKITKQNKEIPQEMKDQMAKVQQTWKTLTVGL